MKRGTGGRKGESGSRTGLFDEESEVLKRETGNVSWGCEWF